MTIAPEGRKLLRLEVRNSETPIERKPSWIRTRARTGPQYTELKALVRTGGLHTVCEEAGCPNIYECWEDREATFLIGGEQCTRRCDFCQIDTGKPAELDRDEPRRVAESVQTMGLRYSTVTGVARDDLPDGGAWLYAETVRQIHELNPGTGVELLIPDFNSDDAQLGEVFDARPEVLAHNLETVPRIFKRIRPAFRYERSLEVLTKARAAGLVTKSQPDPGHGRDAGRGHRRAARPARRRAARSSPSPSTCARRRATTRWSAGSSRRSSSSTRRTAEEIGFAGVMAGPLVRSSYRAGRLYAQTVRAPRRGAVARRWRTSPPRAPRAQEARSLLARCSARCDDRTVATAIGTAPVSSAHGRQAQARQGSEEGSPPREARRVEGAPQADLGSLQDAAPRGQDAHPADGRGLPGLRRCWSSASG